VKHDIVLRLKPPLLLGLPRIEIEEPAEIATSKGRLAAGPPAWSVKRRYFAGAPDVDGIGSWLYDSLGSEMARAISGAVSGPMRLFVTSTAEMEDLLLTTPWEVLEESRNDLQLDEEVSLIRSFDCGTQAITPQTIDVALRLLVTFANPDDDIPHLDEHLQDLRALVKTTDDAIAIEVVELTDYATVQSAGAKFGPNVVYHIGHAEQPEPGDKVSLRIGARGKRAYLNGAHFTQLMQSLSPNVFVLNACTAVSGQEMNPYLGIAREALAAASAIVCMQTQVPTGASRRFGEALLGDLANGVELSRAVKHARFAMIAGQPLGGGGLAHFTRFIPVQLACGRADPRFTVAERELSLLRLKNRLKSHLETIERLLPRSFDAQVDDLLSKESGVALITGPTASGKSTSLRARLRVLIDSAEASRYLYYKAQPRTLDKTSGVRQLVDDVTGDSQFGWLTASLKSRIAEKREPDAQREISELATWLAEETFVGRRNVVVLDDLPPSLATEIATIAARVIRKGLLVVVTREDAPGDLNVHRIAFTHMTEEEIAAASGSTATARDMLQRTGGVPYFVLKSIEKKPIVAEFLGAYIAALPEEARRVVQLAALSRTPLPHEWVGDSGDATPLLRETNQQLGIIDLARDAVVSELSDHTVATLRTDLFEWFDDGARQRTAGATERERARRWKEEAIDQALELAKLYAGQSDPAVKSSQLDPIKAAKAVEECLENARSLSFELHRYLILETGDAVSAKALWERYRDVDRGFERDADTAYGEALAGVGELPNADRVLEGVTGTYERDEVQVRALLIRDEVVRRMGRSDTFELRLELLHEAREVALELHHSHLDDKSLSELVGDVEQSLGNALAYGRHARLEEAEKHLREAFRIFNELGDPRAYRASSEIIEMRRYNELMSEAERQEAIETIRRQFDHLVISLMREDAVRHRYELGRLNLDPRHRAKWFRAAFETAGDSYAPLNWHAALQWKIAELEAGDHSEAEIRFYAEKLASWPEDVWSLRLRRRALLVLASSAITREGGANDAAQLLSGAWQIVEQMHEKGEGRGDRAERLSIAHKIDHLSQSGTSVLVDERLLRETLQEA
jgi:hypothetical protein